jgi:archaellum biogenesis ATPase FlaH
MANNKEKNEQSFFEKGIKKSVFSEIKKRLVFSPSYPFSDSLSLPYKLAYEFLSSHPDRKLVWFSTDKTIKKTISQFKDYGFGIEEHFGRIIFIDLVTKGVAIPKEQKGMKIFYIGNPDNLVEVSMLLHDIFADSAVDIAVIDSLNGLLAFNPTDHVLRFVRFLSVIAEETGTTIITSFFRGQFSAELEYALQIPCDMILSVEGEKAVLKTKGDTFSL